MYTEGGLGLRSFGQEEEPACGEGGVGLLAGAPAEASDPEGVSSEGQGGAGGIDGSTPPGAVAGTP